MICTECGQKLDDNVNFCSNCGKPMKSAVGDPANQSDEGEQEQKIPSVSAVVIPDIIEGFIEPIANAISLEGNYLAMCVEQGKKSNNYKLQIMDISSGKLTRSVDSDDEWPISHIKFEAVNTKGDCDVIANTSGLFMCNTQNGETTEFIYDSVNPWLSIAHFSGDGNILTFGRYYFNTDYDKKVNVLNLQIGNGLLSISGRRCMSFIQSPIEIRYAVPEFIEKLILSLLDARNERYLFRLEPPRNPGIYRINNNSGNIGTIALSHDGTRIAALTTDEFFVKIWDTETGNLLHKVWVSKDEIPGIDERKNDANSNNNYDCFICFSPNDKFIVVSFNGLPNKLIDSETGKISPQRIINGYVISSSSSSFSEERRIFSYSQNTADGLLKIWVNESLILKSKEKNTKPEAEDWMISKISDFP